MKARIIIIWITVLICNSLFAQTIPSRKFVLSGKLLFNYNGYIKLSYEGKEDSALVINNSFSFKGTIKKSVALAGISLKGKNFGIPGIYLESTSMNITMSLKERKLSNGQVSSSLIVDSYQGSKTGDIEKEYNTFYALHKSDSNFHTLLVEKINYIVAVNPESPLSGTLVFQLALNDKVDREVVKGLYSKLKGNPMSKFQQLKTERVLFPEKYVQVNNPVYEFTLPDQSNQMFSTKSLKGKWYFIDFWASWCGPCRAQLPELKTVYEQNKNNSFQILSVSIDTEKKSWLKAIDVEGLKWFNVIENKGFEGDVAKKYQLTAIPSNFLINPEGKIVAKNLTMKELGEKLRAIK